MPRPVKEEPRDRFKTFRFTEAEVARLEAMARLSGRSLSSYVRRVLLEWHVQPEAGHAMRKAVSDEAGQGRPEFAASRRSGEDHASRNLAEQMRRVGVNLNQIARRMNEQRIPPPRELTMLLDDIRTYVRQVREP